MAKSKMAAVWSGTLVAASLLAPAPVAQAEPLAEIRGTVTKDRIQAGCPELKYNQLLQEIAFAKVFYAIHRVSNSQQLIAQYPGKVHSYVGYGDPMAAAVNHTYRMGAGDQIRDCAAWSEYGVAFIRVEDREEDYVSIVFGRPEAPPPENKPAEPPKPQEQPKPQEPPPPPPKQCPPGGLKSEVPAGQECPPPTNAVRVSFDRGLGVWTVNVRNEAGIGGRCTYRAVSQTGLTGVNRDFDIAPNGSASFSVPAPPPLTTYEVTTTCTGTYDGKQVEFGRDVQKVSL